MLKEISTEEEYNELINQGAIPIDVRSEEEYNAAKIPNTEIGYDWNNGEFMDKFIDLDSSKTYVMICRSGNRSMQAGLFLMTNGFESVYNLKGGMINWSGPTD